MEGIKKIVNVLVMIYLVAAALIYLKILNVGQDTTPGFYTTFFVVGGILMLLELIVENLYIMTLRRGHLHNQQKINELKASLYDHKQEIQDLRIQHAEAASAATAAAPPPAATSYTTTTAPITAAPTGTEPVPPVVKPVERTDNPHVIITPSPTPGIQDPERRLPENSDT